VTNRVAGLEFSDGLWSTSPQNSRMNCRRSQRPPRRSTSPWRVRSVLP